MFPLTFRFFLPYAETGNLLTDCDGMNMFALSPNLIRLPIMTTLILAVSAGMIPVLAQDVAPAVKEIQPLLPDVASGEISVPDGIEAANQPAPPTAETAAPAQAAAGQGEFLPPSPPPEDALASPSPAAPSPSPVAAAPVAGQSETTALPAPGEQFNENLFFDAEALVPEGELARKAAPSNVDPVLNPGSRLVVATKDFNPNSREARLVAAERAMKLGRFEAALEIYEGLYMKNKRDPNILLGRAIALQNLNRDDEAINAYEEILNVRPDNLDAQINLNGLVGKRYPAVALQKLQEIYRKNPGNTAVVAQMAVMEAKLGRYEEAVRFLGTAASMEPQNANHVFNMAVIADRAGDKAAAIKYYEEALEIDTLYGAGRSIPRDSVFARLAQLR